MPRPDAANPPCLADPPRLLAAVLDAQNDVARAGLDLARVRQTVVDRARLLAGADGAAVALPDHDHLVCRAASGTLTPRLGAHLPFPTALALRHGTAGDPARRRGGAAERSDDADVCRALGVRSVAWVPLARDADAQPAGVLAVVAARPNAFDDTATWALRFLAGLLACATANAAEAEARQQRLLAERTAALAAQREGEQRFRGAFQSAAIGMAIVALDGRCVQVNAALCHMLGYGEDALLATTFQAVTHPDDLDADLGLLRRLVAGEVPSYRMAKRYFHRDGRVVWAQLGVSLVRDAEGAPLYFVAQVQDVTDARRKEAFDADQRAVLAQVAQDRPLQEALARLAEAVERQVDGAWASLLMLHDGDIQHVGPNVPPDLVRALRPRVYSFAAGLARRCAGEDDRGNLTGTPGGAPTVGDVATDPLWDPARAAAVAHGVRRCWAAPVCAGDHGTAVVGMVVVHCRHDRAPTPADAEMLDAVAKLAAVAAEHHQTTVQLAHLVRHDPLTGLPNRVCFEDRLQQAMASARRTGRRVALFVLDVDHFKRVNDTLGHDAGDALLRQFALRLRGQLRETDTMARMGGDEFTVVLPDLPGAEAAVRVAEKLTACLGDPFHVNGQELSVTSSIGVALYPDDGDDSATLQRRADEQMYLTKRAGRNGYSVGGGTAPEAA